MYSTFLELSSWEQCVLEEFWGLSLSTGIRSLCSAGTGALGSSVEMLAGAAVCCVLVAAVQGSCGTGGLCPPQGVANVLVGIQSFRACCQPRVQILLQCPARVSQHC